MYAVRQVEIALNKISIKIQRLLVTKMFRRVELIAKVMPCDIKCE